MPRAIWSGAISFGLVNIPVKLFSAVQRKTVRFHQLDAKDNTRIQQKRVNPSSGREVPYEELVKGYEISPDQYVVISPREGILTMETLLFGDEVIPPDSFDELPQGKDAKASKKEIDMAKQLIGS